MTPDKGPSPDAVRSQLREERRQVADSSPDHAGESVEDVRDREQEDPVARVEAARSAEARMATESASAMESADAAGRGSDPDQGPNDRGDGAAVRAGAAAADEEAESQLAAEPDNGDGDHLRAERDRYLDLARRTQADFDNYRKRAAKDAAAAGARAKTGLVRELLPVVDNLERALASASESDEGIAQGVRLVHADLMGLLERNGIESQEPSGERFDPTVHEAVSVRQEDGAEAGIVLDVVEKGYKLGDTIIRPARVVVSG